MTEKGLTLKRPRIAKGLCSSRRSRRTLQCYLVLSTQIIGLAVFSFYPMLWAAQKAFYYYDGIPSKTVFTGLENFIKIFTADTGYWKTWINTFIFAIGKMPLELTLAMLIALCLKRKLPGTGFFRSMYYMPAVIATAITGLMFTNMFDYFGFINAWLMKLGIISEGISWFSETKTAMIVLVLGSTWSTFGTNVLYFLAAMSNIPKDLYESASLDGATGIKAFRHITLPMMAPVLQTILLLSLNGTIHTSDWILVTTNGAPAGSTHTVMSYLTATFAPGFAQSTVNIGYGAAQSIITSVGMVIIALIYARLTKKMSSLY